MPLPRGHFGPDRLIGGVGCPCVGGIPLVVLRYVVKARGASYYLIDSPHIRAHDERAYYEKTAGTKLSWDAADLEWNAADLSARESTVEDFCGEANLIPRWLKGKVELTDDFPKALAEKIKEAKFHSFQTEDHREPGGFWAQQSAASARGCRACRARRPQRGREKPFASSEPQDGARFPHDGAHLGLLACAAS